MFREHCQTLSLWCLTGYDTCTCALSRVLTLWIITGVLRVMVSSCTCMADDSFMHPPRGWSRPTLDHEDGHDAKQGIARTRLVAVRIRTVISQYSQCSKCTPCVLLAGVTESQFSVSSCSSGRMLARFENARQQSVVPMDESFHLLDHLCSVWQFACLFFCIFLPALARFECARLL